LDNLLNYVVQYRGIEKILIILSAMICIVLGYKLFRHGINDLQSAEWESSNFSLKLTRVSPGTFFAILGAGVLLWAVYNNTEITITNNAVQDSRSNKPKVNSLTTPEQLLNVSDVQIVMAGGSSPDKLYRSYNTIIDLLGEYDWEYLTVTERRAVLDALFFIKQRRDLIVKNTFGEVNYNNYEKYYEDYFSGKEVPKKYLAIIKEINESLSENFIK